MTATPSTITPRQEMHHLPSGVELHALHWDPLEPDGDLRALVLTHGLGSNAQLWDGVARRLVALGHRVVTVDQRGHGQSSKPDGGYDIPTCADDLALLLDALDFDRPAVAGQSWGGNVVLELGYRHPAAVDQVICVDGGFIELRGRFPDWDEARQAMAPPRLAGTPLARIEGWLATSMADWPEEGRQATLASFEVLDDGTIAPWLTFDRHLLVLRGLWEHSPASRYPQVEVPVLLIAADTGDVNWTHSKEEAVDAAVAALRRGRAEWFRPAHHDVHAQQPAAVATLLHEAVTAPDFYPEVPA